MARKFHKRTKKVSKKLKKVVTKIAKRIVSTNQEHKYLDIVFNNSTIDYSGSSFSLADVPQGDTDSTRDGDALMPTSLDIRLSITNADATNLIRICIIRWHSNVSTLAVANILQYANQTYAPQTPFVHDGRGEFQVLHDGLHSTNTVNKPQIILRKKLRLAKKAVHYTAGTTAGREKIFLIALSDSAAASHPYIAGYIRFNYTDM